MLGNATEQLNGKESRFSAMLKKVCPTVDTIQRFGLEYQAILSTGKSNWFDDWLAKAANSQEEDLVNSSKVLPSDDHSVKAAMDFRWNNGQVEGQVNRLKSIERSIHGISRFALLSRRVFRRP